MKFLSAGESHGKKNVVIIDDVPCGINLSEKDINFELKRRSEGLGRSLRQDQETNLCRIVSGVDEGKTTGNPVCIEVENNGDGNFEEFNIARPGHADLNGVIKYNFDSVKNVVERASARETVSRVAAGTLAKNFLAEIGVEVYSYVVCVGSAVLEEPLTNLMSDIPSQTEIAMSEVMCPDKKISEKIIEQITRAANEGDSLGGKIKVVSVGLVPGLGGYSQGYSRIDSKLAKAMLSVPSVKTFEIGSAVYQSKNVSSASLDMIEINEHNGAFYRSTNYSGGIEGGMTNGMPLILSASVKPVPTINKTVKTIDLDNFSQVNLTCKTRSDICVVPNVAVICESEIAIVLANEYQDKFGHDSIVDIKFAVDAYKQRIKSLN